MKKLPVLSFNLEQALAVSLFSFIGLLTRVGIENLFSTTNVVVDLLSVSITKDVEETPIFSDYFSNIFGCLVMGVVMRNSKWFTHHYPVIYVGLTSGLAGCITTFSTFNVQAFLNIVRKRPVNWLVTLTVGWLSAVSFYNLGFHLASLISFIWNCANKKTKYVFSEEDFEKDHKEHHHPKESQTDLPRKFESQEPQKEQPIGVIAGIILLLVLIGVFLILVFESESHRSIWFSCLFAPIGALIRWYLAQYNQNFPRFPIFTFGVNLVGTLILGGLYVLVNEKDLFNKDASLGAQFVAAAGTGFCGCLTTVSTLVKEYRAHNKLDGYINVVISFGMSQIMLISTFGVFFWAKYG